MSYRIVPLTLLLLGALCPVGLSCSPQTSAGPDGGDGAGDGPGGAGDGAPVVGPDGRACVGLQCRIADCRGKGIGDTTLSGVVRIPAGTLPLYDATVYVPNSALPPQKSGASCDRCDAPLPGNPVTVARTDVTGTFTLKNVPAGQDVPLVISLGKWRRQITVPAVTACADTRLDPEKTRLPKNRGEGDIPRIALTTGGYDALECLLRKLGIDDAEFTPEAGQGRVSLFAGHGGTNAYKAPLNGGAAFTVASDTPAAMGMPARPGWWSTPGNLLQYDILMLSCEGGLWLPEKSQMARDGLQGYIDAGGHVFASHWQNVWMADGPPPLSTVGTFLPVAQGIEYNTPITATVDTSFDRGRALADWLANAGTRPRGTLPIVDARSTVQSLTPGLTQRYVYYTDTMRNRVDPQYFTFNAPVGAPAARQCGRMVFTDMHASGNDPDHLDPALDISSPATPFPAGCKTTALTPQEQALIFLLFELSNCVQPILG